MIEILRINQLLNETNRKHEGMKPKNLQLKTTHFQGT